MIKFNSTILPKVAPFDNNRIQFLQVDIFLVALQDIKLFNKSYRELFVQTFSNIKKQIFSPNTKMAMNPSFGEALRELYISCFIVALNLFSLVTEQMVFILTKKKKKKKKKNLHCFLFSVYPY